MKTRPSSRSTAQVAELDDDVPNPRSRTTTGRGWLRAGHQRLSIDLPDALYSELKIQAAREKRPMRELVEEAVRSLLGKRAIM